MLKRVAYIALVLVILFVTFLFTSMNTDAVTIDLAFGTVQPTVALALAVTFGLGSLFGMLCAGFYVLRLQSERRRLRSALRNSESEVSSLRSLPIVDAE